MNPLNDPSLVIALKGTTPPTRRFRCLVAFGLDVAQSAVAVRLRFSGTEEVQVGAVYHEDVDAGHFRGGRLESEVGRGEWLQLLSARFLLDGGFVHSTVS
jgi:hypothetical protein